MLSDMDQNTTALERAFYLARSGDHRSLDDIKHHLRAECYSDAQITGATLSGKAYLRAKREQVGSLIILVGASWI